MLTIDDAVQRAGEEAISSIGLPGGFVAMNINDGQLYGLGSSPGYDPSIFAKPRVPPAVYKQLTDEDLGAPLFDRATNGFYPAGSTFKPITALAALDSGEIDLNEIINDTGDFALGDGQVLHNAGDAVHGAIDLRQALKVSSDVFFYTLGARTNDPKSDDGGPIQEWARALGLGEPTGLDVGGEGAGRVPTPEQRNDAYAENTAPDSPCGKEICLDKGEVTDREWSLGDNVNLAIGQGDVQVDPLQMAVAYAALANGGDIVRPHVGLAGRRSAGPRDPGDRPGGPRPHRDRPGGPADDHGWPARGRDGARGHLLSRSSAATRSISPARRVRRRPPRAISPGTSRSPRTTTPGTWSR